MNWNMGWAESLRFEFEAHEGSFLLELRCGLNWDEAKFNALCESMWGFCVQNRALLDDREASVVRWIADGFYYFSWFPRSWTSEWGWRETPYGMEAIERIENLCWWFFTGDDPFRGQEFQPIFSIQST
ncbi:MAG: hypothetical protein KY445_08105 [Armatimonadetes bacterium]|nr:hypothetical protein [Armatimonadota bacterium]